jgi:hypothetical protein
LAVVTQLILDVRIHLTVSLLVIKLVLKFAEFVPTLLPFIFHWYTGLLPPFVTTELKLTKLFWHIVEDAVPIEIEGVLIELTVITRVFELAVLGFAQLLAELKIHFTESPLFKSDVLNVAELPPAFNPFTFH